MGTTWEEDGKRVLGMAQRGSLDCILEQAPPNRTREMLLPISKHFLDGTLFDSDGWRAYGKLAEHLDLEDCLHDTVNYSDMSTQTLELTPKRLRVYGVMYRIFCL